MMVRKAKSLCIERRTIAGASGYKVFAGFLMVRHMTRDMVRPHNHPFYWSLSWIDLLRSVPAGESTPESVE